MAKIGLIKGLVPKCELPIGFAIREVDDFLSNPIVLFITKPKKMTVEFATIVFISNYNK
jgi:hypothetical protein